MEAVRSRRRGMERLMGQVAYFEGRNCCLWETFRVVGGL